MNVPFSSNVPERRRHGNVYPQAQDLQATGICKNNVIIITVMTLIMFLPNNRVTDYHK